MGKAGNGLGKGALLQGHGVGEPEDDVRADFAEARPAAVPVNAHGDVLAGAAAEVVVAGGARRAAAAPHVGIHRDLVADLDVGHFASDLGDHPGELVAERHRARLTRKFSL